MEFWSAPIRFRISDKFGRPNRRRIGSDSEPILSRFWSDSGPILVRMSYELSLSELTQIRSSLSVLIWSSNLIPNRLGFGRPNRVRFYSEGISSNTNQTFLIFLNDVLSWILFTYFSIMFNWFFLNRRQKK